MKYVSLRCINLVEVMQENSVVFLFQMTGFLQKSDQFSVKSVRDSVAEFW
jgi:hypothetical protein